MKYYEFPCGCKFPIVDEDGLHIKFVPNIENIPLDCPRTWDLIGSGNTLGCFQLESHLGKTWAKKLKPENMEQLAALIAILRPGCMNSQLEDGKSVAQHYVDRKNGKEPVEYFHPALEDVLYDSYSLLIYQEQSMHIARKIAGFDLQEANMLRKAIGKKLPEVMAKVKQQFLDGAQKVDLVNEEEAQTIFSWIEASQNYAFNKSHSVEYAMNTYLSAYAKAHFVRAFFTSYLYFADGKANTYEEIGGLANNAKMMNIDVKPPDIRHRNQHFKLIDKIIYFGMSDIKSVGKSVMRQLESAMTQAKTEVGKDINDFHWAEFLVFISPNVKSDSVKALISAGTLDCFDLPRTQMLYEFEIYNNLNKNEQSWCKSKMYDKDSKHTATTLIGALAEAPSGKSDGCGCSTKPRKEKVEGYEQSLKHPPYQLQDTPLWIAGVEESLMGLAITCSSIESCDVSAANSTCKEFLQQTSKAAQGIHLIAASIDEVKEIKTKRGDNPGQRMAFITASDNTGTIDSVVAFPDVWLEYKRILIQNNHVMLTGERSRDKDGLILKKVYQI